MIIRLLLIIDYFFSILNNPLFSEILPDARKLNAFLNSDPGIATVPLLVSKVTVAVIPFSAYVTDALDTLENPPPALSDRDRSSVTEYGFPPQHDP